MISLELWKYHNLNGFLSSEQQYVSKRIDFRFLRPNYQISILALTPSNDMGKILKYIKKLLNQKKNIIFYPPTTSFT